MQANRLQYIFFFVLLAVSAWVILLVLRPFLVPLFMAVAFAVVFQPLYKNLLKRTGGRRVLSSFISVLIIILVILIPLLFLGGLLFNEAYHLYLDIQPGSGNLGVIQTISAHLETLIGHVAPQASLNVEVYLQQALRWMVSHLDSFFSGFFRILLELLVMLISLFYLFKDGAWLRDQLIALSPLSNSHDERILTTLQNAINSVIKGSLTISITQGVLAGLGFWLFGIPNPILWGLITVIASLIPGIGTSLVLVPAIAYLFFFDAVAAGVGLAIWGGLLVGLIDNFLGPHLIKRGINVHPVLILLSVLGGIAYFGPIGFLAGPVLLSFCFALLELYPSIIKESRT